MILKLGDILAHRDFPDALWQVARVGQRDYYASGDLLSEDSSELDLYLPAPDAPRSAYPNTIFVTSYELEAVSEMLVLARAATPRKTSATAKLLRRQKFRRKGRSVWDPTPPAPGDWFVNC